MPETTLNLAPDLQARLSRWALEQQRSLPDLIADILLAADARYSSGRDGGCGLCDNLEPLFAKGKT